VSVSDWVPIASVVASAAVGLGVPFVVTRHERRDLRADVLRRVGDVERVRWAPADWDEYRQAIYALRGAALVAGAKREVVDHYIFLAGVARRSSDRSWDGDPKGGAIPTRLANVTTDAAILLAEHLWHPIRKHRFVQRRFDQSRTAVDALREESATDLFDKIDWSPPMF
jgi:hypothetical protein